MNSQINFNTKPNKNIMSLRKSLLELTVKPFKVVVKCKEIFLLAILQWKKIITTQMKRIIINILNQDLTKEVLAIKACKKAITSIILDNFQIIIHNLNINSPKITKEKVLDCL